MPRWSRHPQTTSVGLTRRGTTSAASRQRSIPRRSGRARELASWRSATEPGIIDLVSGSVLSAEFARVAAPVDPSKPSTTKWDPVSRLIAEALHVPEHDVYTATVSKAGNLSVRTEQSKRAVASTAPIVVVMWTGPDDGDFDRTVTAAQAHLSSRTAVLVARRVGPSSKWTMVTVLSPSGAVPAAIATAWPKATGMSL